MTKLIQKKEVVRLTSNSLLVVCGAEEKSWGRTNKQVELRLELRKTLRMRLAKNASRARCSIDAVRTLTASYSVLITSQKSSTAQPFLAIIHKKCPTAAAKLKNHQLLV
jgi:hypothetical protein